MTKDYTKQVMEMLIILKNINDNIHKVQDKLFDINCKLEKQEPKVVKHIVVFKDTKKGENKNENF